MQPNDYKTLHFTDMRFLINALSVSSRLLPLLQRGAVALTRLSHHDEAINFQTPDGAIIALVTQRQGNGPFHILLPGPLPTSLPNSSTGHGQSDALWFGTLQIALHQAMVWDPALRRRQKLLPDNSPLLHEKLNRQPPSPLQNSSSAFYGRAQQGIAALEMGILHSDQGQVRAGVTWLAGLGPGLTPAGDDFLVGLLAALQSYPLVLGEAPTTLCQFIAHTAAPQTTHLSAQWLHCAGQGHFGEAWHRLITALDSHSATAITTAAQQILTTGATSGVDAMSGFLFGLGLIANRG